MSLLQPPTMRSPRVTPENTDPDTAIDVPPIPKPQAPRGSQVSSTILSAILFPSHDRKITDKTPRPSHAPGNRPKRVSHNIANLINLTQLILQSKKKAEESEDTVLEEYALCCMHRDHSVRQYLHQHIVNHKYFEGLVLFVITLNIIFLSLDDPDAIYTASNLQFAVHIVEVICTTFYVIETCLKVITYGFILGKHSYLRCSHYNQIDFVVVLSSVLELVMRYTAGSDGDLSKWIGFGKVLRPLRFLAMVPDLQVLLQQFVVAIPLLTNAFVLLAFLFLIWGLVGVQLFAGKLRYRCLNDHTLLFDEIPLTRPGQQPNCATTSGGRQCPDGYSCVYTDENPNFDLTSFDNLGAAVLSIFVSVTMENWTVCMYRIQDAFSFWTWPYFVLLIVFGSFFVINLTLVAIKAQMLDSEETHKRVQRITMEADGTDTLESNTNDDNDEGTDLLLPIEDDELDEEDIRERERRASSNATYGMELDSSILNEHTENGWCDWLSVHNEWIKDNLTSKSWFDNFFMACIGINTLTLTIEHHDQPALLTLVLTICNYVFTGLFLIEMVLKIAGFSFRGYVKDRFNLFDGVIAIISLFEVIISSGAGFLSATRIFRLARIFRMVRVFRVMKIVRYLESFQRLMKVVKKSIHSILYISALLGIFIFMYAMLGYNLFRGKFQFPEDVEYGYPLTPRANFENLYWSVVTVFQILTLEQWVNIMYDGVRATNDLCILYFVSFVVIGVYCLLNMFLAIVLQNFEADHRNRLEAKIQKQREADALKTLSGQESVVFNQTTLISANSESLAMNAQSQSTWRYYLSCRKGLNSESNSADDDTRGHKSGKEEGGAKNDNTRRLRVGREEPSKSLRIMEPSSLLTALTAPPSSKPNDCFSNSDSRKVSLTNSNDTKELVTDQDVISLSAPSNEMPSLSKRSVMGRDDIPGFKKDNLSIPRRKTISGNFSGNGSNSNDSNGSLSSASLGVPQVKCPKTLKFLLEPPTASAAPSQNNSLSVNRNSMSATRVSFSVSRRQFEDGSEEDTAERLGFKRSNSRWSTIRKDALSGVISLYDDDGDDDSNSENIFRVMRRDTRSYNKRKQSISIANDMNRSPLSRSRTGHSQALCLTSLRNQRKSHMIMNNGHSSDEEEDSNPRRRVRAKSVSVHGAFGSSLRSSLRVIQHQKRQCETDENGFALCNSSDNLANDFTNDSVHDGVEMYRQPSHASQGSANDSNNSIMALGKNASQNMQKLRTAAARGGGLNILPEEIALENHIFADNKWYRILRHFMLCSSFQSFILILIVISSINLAIDTPTLDKNLMTKQIIDTLDTVLVVIFTVEMILKIFVMGLIGMEGAYLSDRWNQLDGAIVITSIIPKILGSNGGILGTFRVLRAFRPLRIAARYEELRIVLSALGRSVPAMVNVLGVLMFFFLIFGILSVQLFGGKFYDCFGLTEEVYATITTLGEGANDKEKCIFLGGTWDNTSSFHFDNIFDALKALFVISTLEGWHMIMYRAVDATNIYELPRTDANVMAALFFIIFILVGSFFLISLFVGIIFDNFVKLRDEATGVGMLTMEQKNWVTLQNKIITTNPIPLPLPPSLISYKAAAAKDTSKAKLFTRLLHNVDLSKRRKEDQTFRGCCYYIGISAKFEMLMMIAICLNIGVMCFHYEGESATYAHVFDVINTVFTWIFVLEAAIKSIGFGVRQYWNDHWNKFDFLIVVGALFEFVMDYMVKSGKNSGAAEDAAAAQAGDVTILRLLRVFRVSRLVRIVKSAERLKSLMRTLVKSCRSLLSIGILLGLMYFVSAILAMNIFYTVDTSKGVCINTHANFENFMNSLLTIFRVSTGEDWDCIMADACTVSIGGHNFCWLFFMLFYLIVSFVTLNLFIAIILQAFDPNEDGSDRSNPFTSGYSPGLLSTGNSTQNVTEDMIAEFLDSWSYFDPLATGYMDYSSFEHFLQKIRKPMGIGQNGTRTQMFRILNRTEIIVHHGNRLNFTEVLYSMCERIDGCWLNEDSKVYHKINKQLARRFDLFEEDCPSLGVLLAVTKAQRIWKKKIAMKKAKERVDSINADREALQRMNTMDLKKGESKLHAFMNCRRDSQNAMEFKRTSTMWSSRKDRPKRDSDAAFMTPPGRNEPLSSEMSLVDESFKRAHSANCNETKIEIESLLISEKAAFTMRTPEKPKAPPTSKQHCTPRTKKIMANEAEKERKQSKNQLQAPAQTQRLSRSTRQSMEKKNRKMRKDKPSIDLRNAT